MEKYIFLPVFSMLQMRKNALTLLINKYSIFRSDEDVRQLN